MARPHPDRMSFLEHLEELRVRLVHSLVALCITTLVCWTWHEEIFHFLTSPLRKAYPDIKFIYFEKADVVRHRLVRDILQAFDEFHRTQTNPDDGSAEPHAEA